jgi:hypothetical protein
MTRQIVIKLNEKKFKQILNELEKNGYGPVKSHSEFVGKVLFFEYLLWNQKCGELNKKTRMNFLMEKLGETSSEFMKKFLLDYNKFISPEDMKNLSKITECSSKTKECPSKK